MFGMNALPRGDFGPIPSMVWQDIHDCVPNNSIQWPKIDCLNIFRQMSSDQNGQPDGLSKILVVATKHGQVWQCPDSCSDTLLWLMCHGFLTPSVCQNMLYAAAMHGRLKVCQLLECYNTLTPWMLQVALDQAATHGHLDVCQWIVTLNNFKMSYCYGWHNAVKRGHMHVARWMTDHFGYTRKSFGIRHLLEACVDSRDVSFCQWMKNKFEITADDIRSNHIYTLEKSVLSNLLDMIQWFVMAFDLTERDVSFALVRAADVGHTAVCRWLIEHFQCTNQYFALNLLKRAQEGKHSDMCQWLTEWFHLTPTNAI